jgi:hypothetical protein
MAPLQAADQARPRDAAEAVREGDVSQWLKYYERERAEQRQGRLPEHAEKDTCAPDRETGERASPRLQR